MKLRTQKQKRIKDMNKRFDKMTNRIINALIILAVLLTILNFLVIL